MIYRDLLLVTLRMILTSKIVVVHATKWYLYPDKLQFVPNMNTIWIVMPILIVLMFLLGIDINKKAFTDIARHPKAVLLGASGNMLCIAHECNPTYICIFYQKKTKIDMAKKEGIRKLFDNIAPDYDRLNHILSLNIDKGWRKKAVRQIADEDRRMKVLDVACGTGDFTIEIAQKVAHGSEVTGIDISEGMLAIGKEKIKKAGVTAELYVADCEALPYEDNTFDRLSVGFGVRNFEHLDIGLKEMYRVLKPDGKLVILELSVPSNPIIRWFYKLYFLKILPAVGGLVSGDRGAYEYLPASVLRFPAPKLFIQMMRSAGFGTVEHTPFTFGICRMYVGKKSES